MAIIVENGSIVAGANSWVTRAAFITYAAERGVTIADTVAADVMLIKAAEYITGMGPRLIGELVDRGQTTAYPRLNLVIQNWHWLSTEIPLAVINAQLAVALEINAGEDPYNPTIAELPTISKRVEGAVAIEYADPSSAALKISKTRTSTMYITQLLRVSGLTVVRV